MTGVASSRRDRSEVGFGDQEREAVRVHSTQADDFASRYGDADPWASCFAYSRHRLDDWLERLLPGPGSGRRLLDAGCGTGHHLSRFRRHGFEVVGMDGSADMLRHAQESESRVQRASVDALPYRTAAFDVVLSIEVLRYLPDPLPSLREAARVLRPGGVLVATAVPRFNLNGYWLLNRLAVELPLPRVVRLKQFFTTQRELRAALHTAGFSAVEIHGVYFGPINWIERLAPRILSAALRRWERFDRALADRPSSRDFANMLVLRAVRS